MTYLRFETSSCPREQRRPDWRDSDRRQSYPWVRDINDRRSGFDRRVNALRPQVAQRETEALVAA